MIIRCSTSKTKQKLLFYSSSNQVTTVVKLNQNRQTRLRNMAAPNVVNKSNLAFIDFEFVIGNHEKITSDLVEDSIKIGLKAAIDSTGIDLEFDEDGLTISDFIKKGNKRRVKGWFSCLEIQREKFLKVLQQILTDKTVSRIISTK